MIPTYEVFEKHEIGEVLRRLRRGFGIPEKVLESARRIVDSVRRSGDRALVEMTSEYDGVRLKEEELEIPRELVERSWRGLEDEVKSALMKAEKRIADFARRGLPGGWKEEVEQGLTLGQLYRPLDPVGIYIPGGRHPYPSTVLMTGIPARIAGVRDIIFCVPPDREGSVNDVTLAAASLVGNCRVFRVGGAQAIAAMATGTQTIPPCRMVAGPGNLYVAAAKRIVSGVVKIDLEAGPSEIAVYADESVETEYVAADMLAQLEHDPNSMAVLVSESSSVIDKTVGALGDSIRRAGFDEGECNASAVFCKSRDLSIALINMLAPEHLEIVTSDSENVLESVDSAGSVFLGQYSPVVMGDYLAGPSHVLPTCGTALLRGGLSSADFVRTMNVISYSREAFLRDSYDAKLIADTEKMEKHADSVEIRRRD